MVLPQLDSLEYLESPLPYHLAIALYIAGLLDAPATPVYSGINTPTTFFLLSRFPPCARRLEPRKRYIEYGFNSNNEDGRKPRCRSPHHFWCQPISSRCLPPGKLTSQINRLLCVRGLEPGRLRAAALDIGERRSLALTLYQTDFTINHVINVMEHEHPSLFSFAYSARGLNS